MAAPVSARVDDSDAVVVQLEHRWLTLGATINGGGGGGTAVGGTPVGGMAVGGTADGHDVPLQLACGIHFPPEARIELVAFCADHNDIALHVRDEDNKLYVYHVMRSAPRATLFKLVRTLVAMERERRAAEASAAAALRWH